MKDMGEGAFNDLKSIRSFLSCLSTCNQHLTQAVFSVFLNSLLEIINQEDEEKGNYYSAQKVSGMETLKMDAVVSAKYMSKKRPSSKIAAKKQKGGLDNHIGSRGVEGGST
jgi:hypothetical protein